MTITITDACGNWHDTTLVVALPEPLSVTIDQNDTAVCAGQSVILPTEVNGGVAPYTYEWTPADGLSTSNTELVTATPTDTTHYIVLVIDQNGCEARDTVTVNVDTLPQVPVLTQEPNVACHGGANGSITVVSPGPAGWYNYSIDDGNTVSDFQDTTNVYSGLSQGPYTITVMTDAFSHCTSSQTITVESSPSIPSVVVDSLGDILLCPNQGTQEVTATITGGLAPFVVTWEGAEMDDSLRATVYFDAAVCDSMYTVSVNIVDGNACDAHNTYRFHVTDTVAPVLTGTIDTVRIEGCSADAIEAVAPLAMDEDALTALGIDIADSCTLAGSFVVSSVSDTTGSCPIVVVRRYTVTDLCGNVSDTVRQVILVNDETAPTVSTEPIDTLIQGCDATAATAEATTVAELETIGFAIEDVCTSDDDLVVRVKADTADRCPIIITRKYVVEDECHNVSDTMVHTLRINDTVAPVISGSAETLALFACDSDILSNYPAATTVAQLEGLGFTIEELCSYDEMEVHHTVDSVSSCPIVITRTYWLTDACGNVSDSVTHTITIDDTTHPVWNGAITDTLLVSTNCEFVMPDFVAIATASSTDNCTSEIGITQSVPADTVVADAMDVTVTLTDACGNDTTYTIHVTIPEELSVSITQSDTSVCFGESVILPAEVSGGVAPYTYEWTPADGLSASNTELVTAPPTDTTHYIVLVTDQNGCEARDTVTVNVDTLPEDPHLSMTNNTICDGQQNGTITVESPVGEGYFYSLNFADYQDSTNIYTDLETGDYTVLVMTGEGCLSQPVTITVESSQELPRVEITHIEGLICPNVGTQTMTATVVGGEVPFQYTWTGTETSDTLSATVNIAPDVCDSAYIITLQVVDANHCTSTDRDTVFVRDTTPPIISGTLDTITYNGCEVSDAPSAVTTLAGLGDLGLSVSDNCTELMDEVSVRQTEEGNCPLVIRRYYTITDACHMTSEEYLHVLHVFDTVAPEVTMNEVTTHLNICDESTVSPAATTAEELHELGFEFSDVCTEDEALTVEVVTEMTDTICPKVITRRYTVKDACGNVSDTMTHIITIFDSIAPIIGNTIDPITIDGCDTTELQSYPIATTVDALEELGFNIEEACSDVTVHYSQTIEISCPIVVTRTYFVEDACGNISGEVTQVINIQDTTRPDFGITLSDSLLESRNCSFVVPNYVEIVRNTLSDNCMTDEPLTVSQLPAAGETVLSDTVVTITAIDACDNTATMTVRILIPTMPQLSVNLTDTTAICQGSGVEIVASVENGTAPIEYTWSVTPDSPIEEPTATAITVAPETAGSYNYSVAVTDANGCTAMIEGIVVTVHETPDTAVTETTVNTLCTGGYNGTITIVSPVDDNGYYLYSLDGGEYQEEPLFEHLASGDYALTVNTTDGCLSETVTVHVGASEELPSVSLIYPTQVLCPVAGNQAVTATIEGGEEPYEYQWGGAVVDVDAENAVVAIDAGNCDSTYSFFVSILDANNCVDTARATITVLDNTAPVVEGTANIVRLQGCSEEAAPSVLVSVADLQPLGYTVSDDCTTDLDELTLTHVATVTTDSCPIHITRTYLLTDACGNVSDSIFEHIVIVDTIAPTVGNALQTDRMNGCSAEDAPVEVQSVEDLVGIGFSAEDECGAEMNVSVTADTSTTTCPLTITRHYILSDRCGNMSNELTHIIEIYDSVAPVITGTIDTMTVDGCGLDELDNYPRAATVAELLALGDLSIFETCTPLDSLEITYSQENNQTCPIIVTRTYRLTDACGNVSDALTQVFKIQDTTRPQFNIAFADSTLTGNNCSFFVPDYVEMISSEMGDNCSGIEISQMPEAGNEVTENTDVVITVEDECHNVNTMTVHILLPTTPDVTIAQNDTAFCAGGSVTIMAVAENGTPGYSYSWTPGDGLSGTEGATVTASPAAGIYDYTVTVRDTNGCKDTATINVTVYAVPGVAETISTENTLCTGGYNGSITVLSPQGDQYQYSINDTVYQDGTVFSELQQGMYTVYVMSADGCVSEAPGIEVGVSQDMPTVSINVLNQTVCPNDGAQTVTAEISGGAEPFTYTWNGAEPVQANSPDAVVAPVASVCDTLYVFSVNIEDANHCTNSSIDTIVARDLGLPTISGELEVVTYNGCATDVLPAAASTPSELEDLGLELADNCTMVSALTVTSRDEVSSQCPIVINRYYRITDLCGNVSDEFMQTLQVFDSLAPIVTNDNVTTHLNGCDLTIVDAAATTPQELQALGFAFNDGCTVFDSLQVMSAESSDGTCPSIVIRKYWVMDACGNASDTMIHTITVFDSIAPVVTGSIEAVVVDGCDTTVLQNYPIATSVADLQILGVTIEENCSDVTISCNEEVTMGCPITVERTYTVTDACGNVSDEVSQIITIQDTTAPWFTVVIDTQFLAGVGGHFYVPDFTMMVSQIIDDNCILPEQIAISQNPEANTQVTQNLTVTVTIMDSCRNSNSTDIEVVIPESLTIRITQPDARFCFGDSILLTPMVGGGSPDFEFSWTPADGLSTDNAQNVTASPAPGIYHYVVTVTDANGSTASDSVTVTVDSIPAVPQLTASDNTICTGDPNGVITVSTPTGEGYTYSMNGGEYQSEPEFTGLSAGTYTIMVQTTAGCTSGPVEITVENAIEMPEVTLVVPDDSLCPNIGTQEITAEITGGTEPFSIQWSGDGVQASTTETTSVDVDATQCSRMYIVTFDMTDASNCVASATDTIFVSDNEVPTITGTLDVVTYNGCTENDAPAAVTTADELVALGLVLEDNCTAVNALTVTSRDEVSSRCPIVISRYYKVMDLCGNESEEFVQTLQVFDSIAPSVANDNVTTHLNGCDAAAADAVVTTPQALQALGFAFNDGCTVFDSLQVISTESVDGTCPTIIIRKYQVMDACGNVSDTMTHTITVFDSIAPVITGTIADVALDGCDTTVLTQRPAATTVAELVALGEIAIEEICSEDDMMVSSSQTVTEGCPITVVRTYKVTDLCGNVSNEVTETILIQDTVSPVFAAQVQEHLLSSEDCQFVVPDLTEEVRAVSSDNCTMVADSLVITQTPAAGTAVTADMTVEVTVSDACENSSVMTVQLRLPVSVTLSIMPSTTQYCEWDTVELSAVPEGGNGEYTYAWSPATGLNSTTDSIVQVSTENLQYEYELTVTDGNGCTATATYTLPEPSHLTVTAEVQSAINCFEGSDGVAVATASNGVGDYVYAWSTGSTTETAGDLAADTYTVTVTDDYNCTATADVTLTHPDALDATVSNERAVLCFGDANGSGTVTPAGGTAPYIVSIDDNVTTFDVGDGGDYTFTQLAAGEYTVLVTDANGCPATIPLTVTSPELLQMTADTIMMPLCNAGDDGSAIVSVTGGTLPYILSIEEMEVATMTEAGEQQIANLAAGTYTVTVVDSNGCSIQISITVDEPEQLSLTQVGTENVSCNGLSDATATVTFAGGTAPFTLYVNDNEQETTVPAIQEVTFTDLAAGSHTVVIRDDNGCMFTLPVTITEPEVLVMTAGSIVDVLCFGDANGSAVVTPTGGTAPYTVTIDNFSITQTVAGGSTCTFSDLTAGDYTAAVHDANGCETTVDFTFCSFLCCFERNIEEKGGHPVGNRISAEVVFLQNTRRLT